MKQWSKSIYARTIFILTVVLVVAGILIANLFDLQVVKYDYYLGKVLDNLIQENVIKAERGAIYDRNMQALAMNITTYRIFVSPADIKEEDRDTVAKGLSDILQVDYEDIYKKLLKVTRKDETIKKDVDKDTADEVRRFIDKNNSVGQIYLEAGSKRYYPYENSAAQVIGYLGTDGGLFGLELQYNEQLTGTDGKYITARNAKNQSMPSKYDSKIDPKNGYGLVTTLDMNIQAILENYLEQTYKENLAGNNVCGIVMDVETGAIYAMATNWGFDLNSPFTLTDEYADELKFSGLSAGTEEYNELKWSLIYSMWRNKCVSETYEPGSTFKIVTSAIALETGAVTPETRMTCTGGLTVAGTHISCHKKTGHGENSFSYLLQQSCNPAMMQAAALVGKDTFWKYFEEFGYTGKTGIDLPGEASGINHKLSNFNAVELATSSFGQTFKTTPIQQITAVCAVANGGYMVTPHVVESLLDDQGNVVVSYADKTAKRQIISEEVGKELAEILAEGVISGVAKNAYVAGYNVAAKTGTSEKRDEEDKTLRVGSTVAFAPADDPKIAVLIIVDEPGSSVKSGGTVAAPYVAGVIDETLQYLGVGRNYTEEELALRSYDVPDFTSMTLDDARIQIQKAGLKYELIGEGDTIYGQLPAQGSRMQIEGGRIYLYVCPAGEEPAEPIQPSEVTVPDVTGYKVSAALTTLISGGFNVQITGSVNYEAGTGATVISQSIPQGRKVPIGTVIILESRHTDGVEDNN